MLQMFPGPAFDMWGPALACSRAEWNAKLQEASRRSAANGRSSVSRAPGGRFEPPPAGGQLPVSPSRRLDPAYIKFWQKAADRLRAGSSQPLSKFAGEAVTGGIAAVQHHVATASEKQAATRPRRREYAIPPGLIPSL